MLSVNPNYDTMLHALVFSTKTRHIAGFNEEALQATHYR